MATVTGTLTKIRTALCKPYAIAASVHKLAAFLLCAGPPPVFTIVPVVPLCGDDDDDDDDDDDEVLDKVSSFITFSTSVVSL